MGATHFLTKGLDRVKTEMSLYVLAYNFRRLMALMGIASMMNAIRAYALLSKLKDLLWLIFLMTLMRKQKQDYGAQERFIALQN